MIPKRPARKRTTPEPPANFGLAHPRLTLLAEATAIPAKCERLVKRWRKEAVKAEANSIDTGLRWINVQALCIRKCADELERLLK